MRGPQRPSSTMATYDVSLTMMSLPDTWPGENLFMKKYPEQMDPPPVFGRMKREHITPCKIFANDGSVIAEYVNCYAAVNDGWRVD